MLKCPNNLDEMNEEYCENCDSRLNSGKVFKCGFGVPGEMEKKPCSIRQLTKMDFRYCLDCEKISFSDENNNPNLDGDRMFYSCPELAEYLIVVRAKEGDEPHFCDLKEMDEKICSKCYCMSRDADGKMKCAIEDLRGK